MANKGKGCAHPTKVDWCSLVQEKVDYHGGKRLEIASDAGGKYDRLILDRWCSDLCA